jgi:hypothetical protein
VAGARRLTVAGHTHSYDLTRTGTSFGEELLAAPTKTLLTVVRPGEIIEGSVRLTSAGTDHPVRRLMAAPPTVPPTCSPAWAGSPSSPNPLPATPP